MCWSGDVVDRWPGLLGEGPCSTGKGGSAQARGWGLGANKLGSKYWHSACSHRWPLFFLGGRGREMAPADSFVPGGVFPWSFSLWATFWYEEITLPPVCPICFSNCWFWCCICMGCLLAVSLRVGTLLSNTLQAPQRWACQFLRFQALSPTSYKNSWSSASLSFKGRCFGDLSSLFVGSPVCKSVLYPSLHHQLPLHQGRPRSV